MVAFAGSRVSGRLILLLAAAAFLTSTFWLSLVYFDVSSKVHLPSFGGASSSKADAKVDDFVLPKGTHPIDELIRRAEDEFTKLNRKASSTLHEAAAAYRERRGRQPPPWFDRWYAFAREHDALLIEDFFDPIYDDLNPFWAIPAQRIRDQARAFEHRVIVRDGITTHVSDHQRDWMLLWGDLVKTIQENVPDLDMPINVMDESRIIVPWEDISEYMVKEKQTRKLVPPKELKTDFQSLSEIDKQPPPAFDPHFEGGHYWKAAALGCAPGSAARDLVAETDYTKPAPLHNRQPAGTYHGYVQNWTLARQPCEYPEISGLHGTFVEPLSMSNTKKLFPLFGGSKLPMNNEILIPPAMYWSTDPRYSGGEKHGGDWDEKQNGAVWRGAGTGGRNRKENWTRFQRHRFVSMTNGTSVRLAESNQTVPNFVLPAKGEYHLSAWQDPNSTLGEWVEQWSDTEFVHLLCFPEPPKDKDGKTCEYTDPYFSVAGSMPMSEQYSHKYLPDIDGNSFSGRYRGFLGSTSLPIKATIYNEWHDSRLIAWKHFVPMDNTFIDIYGIMEYFMGNSKTKLQGHDLQAKQIAMAGKSWTEMVLRREDMQIYVLRLLLEYARLCDDDRERMGWAEN